MTLGRAAKVCGLPESELAAAIRDKRLKAEYLQPTASFMIAQEELTTFLKARGDWKGLMKSVRPRVLLLDRDEDLTSIVRIRLRRDDRCDLSVATSSDDFVRLTRTTLPDLAAVCLPALLRREDAVGQTIVELRQKHRLALIVYHRAGPDYFESHPTAMETIVPLAPNAILHMPGSAEPLIEKIYELAGVRIAKS